MNIFLIAGSHRQNSESGRVMRYTDGVVKKNFPEVETTQLNLATQPLPFWDEGISNTKVWQPIAAQLQMADALVVVSPEWSGMVPAGLKNFFLLTSTKEISHKPALIVTVSSSRGGSYPVTELRTSSYKNTRLCYIPEHVIVREVETKFHGDTPASEDDAYLRQRLVYALKVLHQYALALGSVRKSGVIDHKAYPNGM